MTDETPAPGPPARARRLRALFLGIVLLATYLGNGRALVVADANPTNLLAIALVRGDGLVLDRFAPALATPTGRPDELSIPYWVAHARRDHHLVSTYPVASAILAAPLFLPQVLVLDRLVPSWETRDPIGYARMLGKNAAAFIAALAGALLLLVAERSGLSRASALVAALASGVGSNMWMTASQGLWQHGPAALALVVLLLLLAPREPSRARLVAAGFAAGALFCFRALDVIVTAAACAELARRIGRRTGWFLVGPAVLGLALLHDNLTRFGSPIGGEVQLERLHKVTHHVAGNWSGSFVEGLAGTLVSPSHGLLVYAPWVLAALALAPRAAKGLLAEAPALRAPLVAAPALLLVLARYAVWWGGLCFGPRYWTELMPVFALVLGAAWMSARPRTRLALGASVVLAASIQLVGALCYPSSWETTPTNVDVDHARLWDLRDTELSRCLREGTRPRGRL